MWTQWFVTEQTIEDEKFPRKLKSMLFNNLFDNHIS